MRARVTAAMTRAELPPADRRPRRCADAPTRWASSFRILPNHFFARIARERDRRARGHAVPAHHRPRRGRLARGPARAGGAGRPPGRRPHRRVAPRGRGGAGAHLRLRPGRHVRPARHVRPLRRRRRRRCGRGAGRDAAPARARAQHIAHLTLQESGRARAVPARRAAARVRGGDGGRGATATTPWSGAPTRARAPPYDVVRRMLEARHPGDRRVRRPRRARVRGDARRRGARACRSRSSATTTCRWRRTPPWASRRCTSPARPWARERSRCSSSASPGRTEPAREIFEVELKVRTSAGAPPA